jgi:hypothetical protein
MDEASEVSRDEERRRILEMLEQGKISAAEADELLAALQGDSAAEGPQPPGSARTRLPGGRAPASGLPIVAVRLARVLARTIGRVSFVIGRVAGTLARLFGRAQTESNWRDR